jgi:hypothetical protein
MVTLVNGKVIETTFRPAVYGLAFPHLDGKFDCTSADAVAHRVRTAVTAIATPRFA